MIDNRNNLNLVKRSADYIRDKAKTDTADIAIIIGTGLSGFAKSLEGIDFPYDTIPYFPEPMSPENNGKLTYTNIADKKILCFQGRLHYYEGYSIKEVVFPIRLIKEMQVKTLIITNSAACLTKDLIPGDLMVIKDHINLMGVNPLIGQNIEEQGKRFVDMSEPYSKRLINLIKQSSPVPLKEGIYIGVTGPNFETPSEVRFFKAIGGSAVGMSTVPEVLVANHCKIETLGISCISNYAAGVAPTRLDRNSVVEIAKKTETDLISVILNFIAILS